MVEKTIQLTGTSTNSIEDAVGLAVSRAAVTIDNIRQVRIIDINAAVDKGSVSQWRVKIDVTFGVEDRLHE
jgi:flavin-binding protein dodecin